MAVHTVAPSMQSFSRGRDLATWIGLTPREVSTGGRQRLGQITQMDQQDLRPKGPGRSTRVDGNTPGCSRLGPGVVRYPVKRERTPRPRGGLQPPKPREGTTPTTCGRRTGLFKA